MPNSPFKNIPAVAAGSGEVDGRLSSLRKSRENFGGEPPEKSLKVGSPKGRSRSPGGTMGGHVDTVGISEGEEFFKRLEPGSGSADVPSNKSCNCVFLVMFFLYL